MDFLLLFAFAALLWSLVLAAAVSNGNTESQALIHASGQRYGLPHIEEPTPDLSKDHDLLDIVLVSSVDGKFHALNRTSGHTLWSMASFATTTSVSAPSSLSPLVRTTHPNHDADILDDPDDPQHETYIIEPQSGDIYVLHSPSSPLQRFPFSMAELVDISPFTSVNGDDTKVFVGRKETSLLLIELETGRIKATLNAECPFIPDEYEDTPIDLDELEGSKPPISAPTEVYIGRTDYIISIHKKPKPGQSAPPAQELSFSTYGPNNKDNHLQALYRRTPDDTYIQPLTNGEIIAFRTKSSSSSGEGQSEEEEGGRPLWGHHFSAPIVAIFDVLQPHPLPHPHAPHPHPFVLLQPRPRLQDLFPTLSASGPGPGHTVDPHVKNMGTAFVGLVEESGSLFVMSPERYPLVVFGGERHGLTGGDGKVAQDGRKSLDPPRKGNEPNPTEGETHLDHCLANPYDPRCLVGVRPLEDGDGLEGRMKRLLDGPKTQTPASQQPMGGSPLPRSQQQPVVIDRPWTSTDGEGDGDNTSERVLAIDAPVASPSTSSITTRLLGSIGSGDSSIPGGVGGIWEAVLVTALFGIVTLWVMWGKLKATVVATKEREEAKHKVVSDSGKKELEGDRQLEVHRNGDVAEPTQVESSGSSENTALVASDPSTPSLAPSSLPANGHTQTTANGVIRKETPTLPSLPPANPQTPRTPSFDVSTPTLEVPLTPGVGDDGDDLSDGEGGLEGGVAVTPGKRKSRRGKRGKKKKPGVLGLENDLKEEDENSKEEEKNGEEKKPSSLVLTTSSPKLPVVQQPSLIVSDTILGFGSHGTVVFRGSLQGRAVAVKRLLNDFVTLAAREVSILQESDDHPNVIRYYYQESHGNFLYIALELCPASLADIIEAPDREAWRDIAINFDPKKALRQITSGLRHLHALKLVHRDIKPQNILVSSATAGVGFGGARGGKGGGYRMLISDFGLCKKLDVDQTSFLPTAHGAAGAGTVGWRAPEILRGEVKLDELSSGDDGSLSSRGSVATINGNHSVGSNGSSTSTPTRLTKSVDIFALGCLFYYTLTNGGHPYGDRFEREVNIMRDAKDLSGLERFGEEGTEAKNLIEGMLSFEARKRPDTTTCLLHPFFWDPGRRLNFLQDASDRFEIMCRDPKDSQLLTLEKGAQAVVGNDWHARLDKIFIENLGKYRKYDGRSVQDLLRALRNKKHHYQDLPDKVKWHLGPMPEGFLGYFTRRYPQLFLHVHGVIKDTGLHTESMFRTYFELPDS